MVMPGSDWAAAGHSMGGGTLGELVGIEPRVRTIIGMQAAANSAAEIPIDNFDGNAYWIAGSVDRIVHPAIVHDWFSRAATNGRHDCYFLVDGMGHLGPLDSPSNSEPLPGAEQSRQHRRLLGGLLRLEMKGEEELAAAIFSEQVSGDPVSRECAHFAPLLWANAQGGGTTLVTLGTAARQNGTPAIAWSPAPDQRQTAFGLLGIDAGQAQRVYSGSGALSGVLEPPVVSAAGFSGQTLWVTAVALGAGRAPQLGNTVTVAIP